jgi:hypothetical protein
MIPLSLVESSVSHSPSETQPEGSYSNFVPHRRVVLVAVVVLLVLLIIAIALSCILGLGLTVVIGGCGGVATVAAWRWTHSASR